MIRMMAREPADFTSARTSIQPTVVKGDADWDSLRNRIDVVVDPLVLRIAELFLAGSGRASAEDDDNWKLIARNLDCLTAFFEALMLYDRIPVFDYWMTYHDELDQKAALPIPFLALAAEGAVLPLTLKENVYARVWQQAANRARAFTVAVDVEKEIDDDLTAAGFQWDPDHARGDAGRFGDQVLSWESTDQRDESENRARRVRNLVRSFDIFDQYARLLGVDHVLPPRRARQLLQTRFNLRARTEDVLYAELRRVVQQTAAASGAAEAPVFDTGWRPSFLPLLLANVLEQRSEPRRGWRSRLLGRPSPSLRSQRRPIEPKDLVRQALNVRNERDIQAYRESWRRMRLQFEAGRIPDEERQSILAVQQKLAKQLAPRQGLPINVSATASPATIISGTVSMQKEVPDPRSVVLGRPHRAVLFRMAHAEQTFIDLASALEKVWRRELR